LPKREKDHLEKRFLPAASKIFATLCLPPPSNAAEPALAETAFRF
jgi:hypothetical protein